MRAQADGGAPGGVQPGDGLAPGIEYFAVPPLCPLVGSPYDFSRTAEHIDRAVKSTEDWLDQGGLQRGGIPHEMRVHRH